MAQTAKRAAVFTLVVVGIVVLVLALWRLRLVIALLFLAFVLAAAMRPTVDTLARNGLPRVGGIALHYMAMIGIVVGFLWAVVPRAIDQVEDAVPETRSELSEEAEGTTGWRHELLVDLRDRLEELPSADRLVDPALEVTLTVFEVALGIFFVLASAAFWIYERDRAEDLVCSMLPRRRRKKVRDTWNLIDAKLGAYVRGQALLILLVGTVLSLAFWAIDLRYWLLVGAFAGVVEIVPILGPLVAGALAVGIGFTDSWQVALAAGIIVLVVRLIEDYFVIPRVLGHAVGLTPLVVLVSVTACGILFGGFAVILAIPAAAVAATLIDVILRNRDPSEEDVPTVIFPAKDAETA
jgi:predicted PurR-regulated permease PerM